MSFCKMMSVALFALSLCAVSTAQSDRFGGNLSIRRNPSNCFRVEQVGPRWVFITPDGHPFVALGANHVGSYLKKQATDLGLLARFNNDPDQAASGLLRSIRELGLNAGDAYGSEPRFEREMPWVFTVDYRNRNRLNHLDVFDPVVLIELENAIVEQCSKIADNPFVLGIAGPDLPRWDSTRVNGFRKSAIESPGRRRYVDFLQQRYQGNIEQFNRAYQTDFASFETLSTSPELKFKTELANVANDDKLFLGMIADTLYGCLRSSIRKTAPDHLFFGERFFLRSAPDEVLKAISPHIDVFCTQALIRSPQRPPEWQIFQQDGYDHEFSIVQKPMVIIDWAAPFSLSESFDSERGHIKNEREATEDADRFLTQALALPYMIGVWKCQLIGLHANDQWFDGKARRTYLRDDGTPFDHRTAATRRIHDEVLRGVYQQLAP